MEGRSEQYPEAYNAWAGNPKGVAPDFKRCCAVVYERESIWPRPYQCQKARGHGPDGAYCKQHDPAAGEARRAASHARYIEKHNRERVQWYGREFFDVLKKIAEGHNDARGLAQETIDKFNAGASK